MDLASARADATALPSAADAAGKGVLAGAVAVAGGPGRVIAVSDPAAEARRQLESGTVHERIILTPN